MSHQTPPSLHDALTGATTADEERQAFTQIHAAAGESGLTFEALDENGSPLNMSAHDWWRAATSLRISVGDESVVHQVVDRRNIAILMGE